jgi:hypothetical protein
MTRRINMWQCQKCGEDIEDAFDACWNCGTSKAGVESANFRTETDVAETDNAGKTNRRWNGFLTGGVVTAFVNYYVFYFVAAISAPVGTAQKALLGAASYSLLIAPIGGLSGWFGVKADYRINAACKGATIMTLGQGGLFLCTGFFIQIIQLPVLKMLSALVYFSALGAIAATVGRVVGRPRHADETTEEPVQYSISDMLFITALFSVLFASVAILSR